MERTETSKGRSIRQWVVLWVGSLGPLGHSPASGTVSVAVVGIPLYLLLHAYVGLWGYIAVTTALVLFGVWIHTVGDRILGEKDSRKLVIDELVGFLIAMTAVPGFGAPPTWQLVVLGFALERAFDISKIWPASWIERRLPAGWGVVGDDVVAGLYAFAILHAIIHWLPRTAGIA